MKASSPACRERTLRLRSKCECRRSARGGGGRQDCRGHRRTRARSYPLLSDGRPRADEHRALGGGRGEPIDGQRPPESFEERRTGRGARAGEAPVPRPRRAEGGADPGSPERPRRRLLRQVRSQHTERTPRSAHLLRSPGGPTGRCAARPAAGLELAGKDQGPRGRVRPHARRRTRAHCGRDRRAWGSCAPPAVRLRLPRLERAAASPGGCPRGRPLDLGAPEEMGGPGSRQSGPGDHATGSTRDGGSIRFRGLKEGKKA